MFNGHWLSSLVQGNTLAAFPHLLVILRVSLSIFRGADREKKLKDGYRYHTWPISLYDPANPPRWMCT